jgi:hypothetical protein
VCQAANKWFDKCQVKIFGNVIHGEMKGTQIAGNAAANRPGIIYECKALKYTGI